MTKLSVNINKIATLRNARGGNVPNLLQVAKDIQRFGAQGITIHPRPDERHIRYQDARDLRPIVYTEFNIEGNPQHNFIDLVLECKPEQVTLVPDAIGAITSSAGWDTIKFQGYLTEVIAEFKRNGITNIKGIDGDWIPRNQLKITPEEFTPHDLTQPYTTTERYDLAISLETAQHLEEIYTRTFITSLCNTSNIIMFSAARPDQHGIGHVNEQPPDYWIKLFAEQGYNFKLHFGWQFNDNNNVSRCYVQNLMILAKETS